MRLFPAHLLRASFSDESGSGPEDESTPPEPAERPDAPDDAALFSYEGFPDPNQMAARKEKKVEEPPPSPEIPEDVPIVPQDAIARQQQERKVRLLNEASSSAKPEAPEPPIEPSAENEFAAPEISADEIYRVEAPKRLFKIDYLLAALLGVLGFAVVISTYHGVGFTWDEAYYTRPAEQTRAWFAQALSAEDKPFSADEIDAFFSGERNVPELPMVPKALFAAGMWAGDVFGIAPPYFAMRIPTALCYALTLVILYLLAGKYYARTGAILTVLCYLVIPRVFGHAHIAATETILVFFTVLFTYCFVKGLDNWRWAALAGVTFGFCLATKVNAFFLPVTLLLWAHIFQRRYYANNVFAIIFIAPAVMLLIWPWLWPAPFARITQYLSFFAQHAYIPVMYYGERYPAISSSGIVQNVPWHYPFILTAFTTPLLVLVLALVGLARTAVNLKNHDIGVLFLLGVIFPLGIAALPFSPKYDGVRLFLPAFPFIALLAGIGGEYIAATIRGIRTTKKRYAPARYFAEALALAILAYGVFLYKTVHPNELSYWNLGFNGIRGAQKAGMEITYWGNAVNEDVYDFISDLPRGTHVRPLALHDLSFEYLQEWDRIDPSVEISTAGIGDIIILQNRQGFFGAEERALFNQFVQGGTGKTLAAFNGVPLVMAFDLRENAFLRRLIESTQPPPLPVPADTQPVPGDLEP